MGHDARHPRIRPGLDFFPVEHEGRSMVCLRDPLEIAPESIAVPPEAFFLIAHMDGQHSILEIQTAFTRRFGQLIMEDQVLCLVEALSDRGFLEGPRFRQRLAEATSAYRDAPLRYSRHAGEAYPDTAPAARAFLEGLFQAVPPVPAEVFPLPSGPPVGVVAPHIDLHRGGSLFARAYEALRDTPAPEAALILGTAHFAPEGGPYILTEKRFETPLGRVPVDHDFCRDLRTHCPFDLFQGELAHRTEHSLEFQVLLLQHIFGPEGVPPIVPVLCTSIMERLPPGTSPTVLPEVGTFLRAAKAAAGRRSGRVLVVAGADMSHVGRKFGTREALSPAYLEQVRGEDEELLRAAARLDGEAFYRSVARMENRNNICSVTAIYTLVALMEGGTGRVLGYDMAIDHENDAAVGFGALNFWCDEGPFS